MEKISERLIFLRGSIARRPFAERIGVTESTLRNYEQEKSKPSAETIEKICKKLRIAPEWLILGTGPIHPEEGQPTNKPQPKHTQPSETASTIPCARCERLEEELAEERRERRELSAELREVNAELRRLARENKELAIENAELRKEKPEENLTISEIRCRKIEGTLSPLDEQQSIPPSERPQPRT